MKWKYAVVICVFMSIVCICVVTDMYNTNQSSSEGFGEAGGGLGRLSFGIQNMMNALCAKPENQGKDACKPLKPSGWGQPSRGLSGFGFGISSAFNDAAAKAAAAKAAAAKAEAERLAAVKARAERIAREHPPQLINTYVNKLVLVYDGISSITHITLHYSNGQKLVYGNATEDENTNKTTISIAEQERWVGADIYSDGSYKNLGSGFGIIIRDFDDKTRIEKVGNTTLQNPIRYDVTKNGEYKNHHIREIEMQRPDGTIPRDVQTSPINNVLAVGFLRFDLDKDLMQFLNKDTDYKWNVKSPEEINYYMTKVYQKYAKIDILGDVFFRSKCERLYSNLKDFKLMNAIQFAKFVDNINNINKLIDSTDSNIYRVIESLKSYFVDGTNYSEFLRVFTKPMLVFGLHMKNLSDFIRKIPSLSLVPGMDASKFRQNVDNMLDTLAKFGITQYDSSGNPNDYSALTHFYDYFTQTFNESYSISDIINASHGMNIYNLEQFLAFIGYIQGTLNMDLTLFNETYTLTHFMQILASHCIKRSNYEAVLGDLHAKKYDIYKYYINQPIQPTNCNKESFVSSGISPYSFTKDESGWLDMFVSYTMPQPIRTAISNVYMGKSSAISSATSREGFSGEPEEEYDQELMNILMKFGYKNATNVYENTSNIMTISQFLDVLASQGASEDLDKVVYVKNLNMLGVNNKNYPDYLQLIDTTGIDPSVYNELTAFFVSMGMSYPKRDISNYIINMQSLKIPKTFDMWKESTGKIQTFGITYINGSNSLTVFTEIMQSLEFLYDQPVNKLYLFLDFCLQWDIRYTSFLTAIQTIYSIYPIENSLNDIFQNPIKTYFIHDVKTNLPNMIVYLLSNNTGRPYKNVEDYVKKEIFSLMQDHTGAGFNKYLYSNMPNYVSFMNEDLYRSLQLSKDDTLTSIPFKTDDYNDLIVSMQMYVMQTVCQNIADQVDVESNVAELKTYMRLITVSQIFPYYVRTYISVYMRQWNTRNRSGDVNDSNPHSQDMLCDSNNPDNYIRTHHQTPKTTIAKQQIKYYDKNCGSTYVVNPSYVSPIPFSI